jgi:hypothetical protein
MYCVEGETGSCSQTVVKCHVGGNEEVSIKVEESIDIKDETPEAVLVQFVKTEHEVRLWGVCVWDGDKSCFQTIYCPRKETTNLHFIVFCLCYIVGVVYLLKFVMKSRKKMAFWKSLLLMIG